MVTHVYNPSYSGGRDQEDHCSKPALANSLQDPILKTLHKKKAGRAAQGEGPMRGRGKGQGVCGEKWPKQCMHI
jgi:hypothetical protein